MGKRTAALALAAGAVVTPGVAACHGGDAGDHDDAATDPANRAATLVEGLDCDRGQFYLDQDGGWAADVRDCEEGPIVARIYGSLTSEEREAAVRSLTSEDGPGGDDMAEWCAENDATGDGLFLVTGDAWVAVVAGDDDAATTAERLDGELHADPVATPPADSQWPLACLPGPQ